MELLLLNTKNRKIKINDERYSKKKIKDIFSKFLFSGKREIIDLTKENRQQKSKNDDTKKRTNSIIINDNLPKKKKKKTGDAENCSKKKIKKTMMKILQKKIAFCFLIKNKIIHPTIWHKFFSEASDSKYCVYIHSQIEQLSINDKNNLDFSFPKGYHINLGNIIFSSS